MPILEVFRVYFHHKRAEKLIREWKEAAAKKKHVPIPQEDVFQKIQEEKRELMYEQFKKRYRNGAVIKKEK